MINKFLVYLQLLIAAGLFLALHLMLFQLLSLQKKTESFYYSIPQLYGLFFILALLVLGVVQKTTKKNFDSTGMVFMIASSIKMGIAYFLVRPILHVQPNKIEKINFFAVFVLFLLLETLFTAKILNKK
jgi:drug/metabolite transporter superfamily protein YnfA